MVAELAGYLQREMKDRKWTQREAAERTGLSKTGLKSLLDNPDRVPDLPTLRKIADGFNVPFRRLLKLCGYGVEEVETVELEVYGLTEEQREFLRNLSPEKKACLVDLSRQMLVP